MMRTSGSALGGSSHLTPTDLTALYKEQWEHIRHLDTLDVRMLAVLPVLVAVLTLGGQYLARGQAPAAQTSWNLKVTAEPKMVGGKTTATGAAQASWNLRATATPDVAGRQTATAGAAAVGLPSPRFLVIAAGVLVFGLSFSGAFTTLHNWYFLNVRLTVITALEHAMGLQQRGIVPSGVQFRAKTDFTGHVVALIGSGRFPLAVLYSVLSGLGVAMILDAMNRVFAPSWVGVSLGVFLYCDLTTFCTIRRQLGPTARASGSPSGRTGRTSDGAK